MTGKKFDGGKLRYDLVPAKALQEVVRVLTYGAGLYGDENWKQVPGGRKRYYAAAQRHQNTYWIGDEVEDKESKTHTLANAIADLLFILEKDLQGWEDLPEIKIEAPLVGTPQPVSPTVVIDWQKAIQTQDWRATPHHIGTPMNRDGTIPTPAYTTTGMMVQGSSVKPAEKLWDDTKWYPDNPPDWIEWNLGKMPDLPETARVNLLLRDERDCFDTRLSNVNVSVEDCYWGNEGSKFDIVAYKVVR